MQQQGGLNQKDQKTLARALNSYKLSNFFPARSSQEIEEIIILARYALTDKRTLEIMSQNVTNVSSEIKENKKWINLLLYDLIKRADKRLKKIKPNDPKNPIKLAAVRPNIEPKQPVQRVVPVIKLEQAEEEIQANRLYIGLDIKDHNTNGKPILWNAPIMDITSIISDDDEFVPSDYFHITIAWYETKNQLSQEMIAQVERALSNASQILKIVFPQGVTGVSLLDGAVFLGNKKDSVAFRVSESTDLKKLQDILLKFLSFEKIEGFRFNTFDRETPIHITLGKIWPSRAAFQYRDIAETLDAPDGARASKGEGFTINTFRLTYSVAGQAWQEKMSYKF
jgi:hypothetical protein